MRDGQAQRALRQVGQGGGDGRLAPHPADIGDARRQGDPALGLAQRGGHLGARDGERDGGQRSHRVGRSLGWPGAQDDGQHISLPQQQVGQIRAAAAQGRQGRRTLRRHGQGGVLRAERGIPLDQAVRRRRVARMRP